MSAVVSLTSYLVNMGAQAGGFRRDVADVARLELDGTTANVLRYVLTDWERAAGVKSNFGAQAERLAAGIYREALNGAALDRKRAKERGDIRLSLDERTFLRRKIPLADRGWPSLTAKPSKASSGGFPLRTVQINDGPGGPALCTVASSEEWAMLPPVVRGWDGPVVRRRVVEVYRALVALERREDGPRLVVALNLNYGQRDPAADYQTFGSLAPLVHLTPTAIGLAAKATRKLREDLAERCVAPDAVAARASAHREEVTPREAVAASLSRLLGADRRVLVASLEKSARMLLARASNALLHELRDGSS